MPGVKTMPEKPGLITRPLNRWLSLALRLPWIASMPPSMAKDEALVVLLMMLAAGAPDWLKSSLSVPAVITVLPAYVFVPASVRVPEPIFRMPPEPLMGPLIANK